MLFRRGNIGKGLFFFLIIIFLAVGVTAVTINVWTYVERGTKNPEAPIERQEWVTDDYALINEFEDCDYSEGEYAVGFKLVRKDGAESVNAQIICENQGTNITFTPNNAFSNAVNRTCTSGPDVMQNIAVASFANNLSGDGYSCTGSTGCSGMTNCGYEAGFPKVCTSFADSTTCEDTDGDCQWRSAATGYCGGLAYCNGAYDNEGDCNGDSNCTWVDAIPSGCEADDEMTYDPNCPSKNSEGSCLSYQGCSWGVTNCNSYDKNKGTCDSKDGCSWDGYINCTTYDKTDCLTHSGDLGSCSWIPMGATDSEFGLGQICPASDPIMVGVAGYNGEGTEYCRGEEISAGVTYSSLYNEQVAGILPKCARADNPNCNYRFAGEGCFWYFAGADGGCPDNHYISGVRGFVGDDSIVVGRDIYIQSYCCSIGAIDHSLEVPGGGDEDCDGLINEGYFAPDSISAHLEDNICVNIPCSIPGIVKSNSIYCQSEGAYYFDGNSSGGVTGTVYPDFPRFLFTVDYDLDKDSCICKFGEGNWSDDIDGWAPTLTSGPGTCCESGTNTADEKEFSITGNWDGSISCCNNRVDVSGDRTVSIGGRCLQTKAYWTDMQGNALGSTDLGDSVQIRVDNVELDVGTEVVFEIWEDDVECIFGLPFGCGDDMIRAAITGTVDNNHNLIAVWTNDADDMDLTNDYGEFYFKVKYDDIGDLVTDEEYKESSNQLEVNQDYNNAPISVNILSPACGDYFNASSDTIDIEINAQDEDDIIEGHLSINDLEIGTFKNGNTIIGNIFSKGGNYKIVAEAVNSRGQNKRAISNIMIIDTTTDGEYVAACIIKPEDYSDIPLSSVEFDASTSKGIQYDFTTGTTTELSLSKLNFDWYFSDRSDRNMDGNNEMSYKFWKNFGNVGSNWATLKVSII